MAHITDGLYGKKWGVFNHYLWSCQNGTDERNTSGKVTSWEECTKELDVELIARQLHDVGAGYYVFTLMQGHRYMAAPNATFDRIAKTEPGQACCTRDIPAELYGALKPYGIDLYLYFTGDGPHMDSPENDCFGFKAPRQNVSADFVKKWAAVLGEYAQRYGDKVSGWWIDGCYASSFNYTTELLKPYYDAVKKGNPNALVSFNDGVKDKLIRYYPDEDFTAGEFNDFTYIPGSRFVDGAQAFILAPLGVAPDGSQWNAWCRPGLKRDGTYMRDYVAAVNKAGGVVTIDTVLYRDGSFDPAQSDALRYINR